MYLSNGIETIKYVMMMQKKNGSWDVITDKGNINAEIVINAGGLWAREVGQLAGLDLPVQPMEHHYLITETIPEIEAMGDQRLPIGTDFEGNILSLIHI